MDVITILMVSASNDIPDDPQEEYPENSCQDYPNDACDDEPMVLFLIILIM